jgi:hypothetical protein
LNLAGLLDEGDFPDLIALVSILEWNGTLREENGTCAPDL